MPVAATAASTLGEARAAIVVPPDVDAGEHHLGHTRRGELFGLGHDLAEWYRARQTTRVRHDAVRAEGVASVLHLELHPAPPRC